jgi:arylsulfatase A-like enzyme
MVKRAASTYAFQASATVVPALARASLGASSFTCLAPRAARFALAPGSPSVRRRPTMSLIPFVPNWLALGSWLYGAYRFNAGFSRTSYQAGYKVPLALAWPLFIAVNSSYRKNFVKAIKKSDDF